MTSTSLTPPSSLDSKLGALFLGDNATAVFFGITSLQMYIYFTQRSLRDSRKLKLLMFSLWIFDALHFASILFNLYHYTVTYFGNWDILNQPVWSLISMVYVTCVSDLLVRSIFAYRIWKLSRRNHYCLIVIGIPAVMSAVAGAVLGSQLFHIKSYDQFSEIRLALYIGLTSGVAADFFIAAVLVTVLVKSQTKSQRTNSILTTLMLYAINTGLFTTICRSLTLITFATWPDKFIYIGIYFVLPDLSLNALLATLNARDTLRERAYGADPSIPLDLSVLNSGTAATSSNERSKDPPGLLVRVDKQTVTDSERFEDLA